MSEHTKGRLGLDLLKTNGHCGWSIRLEPSEQQIATVYADLITAPRPPRQQVLAENARSIEIARRLVACWNYCDLMGFKTESMEEALSQHSPEATK